MNSSLTQSTWVLKISSAKNIASFALFVKLLFEVRMADYMDYAESYVLCKYIYILKDSRWHHLGVVHDFGICITVKHFEAFDIV